MAKVHWQTGSTGIESVSEPITTYLSPGMGSRLQEDGTEARREIRLHAAGTWANLYISVLTNGIVATTLRTRVNQANGGQSVSIGDSATGEFEDTTGTDSIADGDEIAYQMVTSSTAATPTITFAVISSTFDASSNTVTALVAHPDSNITNNLFVAPVGSISNASEAVVEMEVGGSFTAKNGEVFVSANTRDGDAAYTLRVNGANSSLVVAIGAGLTGIFEDTSNTVAIVADDLINWQSTQAGTSGSVTVRQIKLELESTANQFMFGSVSQTVTPFNTTHYQGLAGTKGVQTTEANVVGDAHHSWTAKRLDTYVSFNTIAATSTFRLRKNAADGNLAASITASSTGHFSDDSNTDAIADEDSLCYAYVCAGASGEIRSQTTSMMGEVAGGGGGGSAIPAIMHDYRRRRAA